MKKFMTLVMAVSIAILSAWFLAPTHAAADVAATGTIGTCDWDVTSDGVLTIHSGTIAYDENALTLDFNELWGNDNFGYMFMEPEDREIYDEETDDFLEPTEEILALPMITKIRTDGKVTLKNAAFLFNSFSSVEEFDLRGFDTSSVVNMNYMFNGCDEAKKFNLSSFDTSNVTTMDRMFEYCGQLETIDLSSFNTGRVTDMFGMFSECYSLRNVDVSSFNTSKVTSLATMFQGCANLESVDLSSFQIMGGYKCNASWMFKDCASLRQIKCGKWDESCGAEFPVDMVKKSTGELYKAEEEIPTGSGLTFVIPDDFTGTIQPRIVDLTIKFNANGGSVSPASKKVVKGYEIGTLPTPKRSGYYFKGWYTKKSGGTKVTSSYVASANKTFYAQWGKRTSIAKAKVTVSNVTYNGKAQEPSVKVVLSKKTLKKGTDYKLSYSNNVNASSKAKVTVTGINKYSGSLSKTFTIKKHGMDKTITAKFDSTSYTYTGKAIKPGIAVYFNKTKMKLGKDYTVSFLDNKEPGKAYAMVTGKGNFTNTSKLFGFTIDKAKHPLKISVGSFSMHYKDIGTSTTVTVSGMKEKASVSAASSNKKVATVEKSGSKFKITVKGVGTAKITFKTTKATKHYAVTSKSIEITVADRKVPTISFEKTQYNAKPDDAPFIIKATTNSDGTIKYVSSDTSIASISADGTVTLTGKSGNVTITATVIATKLYKENKATANLKVCSYPPLNYMIQSLKDSPFFQYDSGDHSGDCAIASVAVLRTLRGNGKTPSQNYDDVWAANGNQSTVQSWADLGLTVDYDVSLEHIYKIMKEKNTPVIVHRYNPGTHFSVIYAYVGSDSVLEKSGFLVYDVKDVVYNNHLADNLAAWDNYKNEGYLSKIVY